MLNLKNKITPEKRNKVITFSFFSFWIIYFFFFWAKALHYDSFGNLVAGHVNIWGDWAAHMTMGTAMAARGPLLQESPLIIGQPFAYPFVSNLISAILYKTGFSLIDSFIFPSFFFSIFVVYALVWFFNTFFKSRKIALLATTIFLLNGGIGFFYFIQDIVASPDPVKVLLNPPHEYTRYDEKGIKWISVIDSMIIPQRAFGLGFPLGLIALGLIYTASYQQKEKKATKMIQAGSIIGLLPIIHSHTFLALFILLSFWSSSDLFLTWQQYKNTKQIHTKLKKRLVHWASLASMIAVLAIPLISLFLSQNVEGFINWYPGWLAVDFEENWFIFWFKNWTIVPLLSLAGFYFLLRSAKKKTRNFALLFIPFFILFIISNLWLFQPYAWDNTKLLVWSSVGFSGLTAWILVKSWNHASHLIVRKKSLLQLLVFSCLMIITASGAIDAYYISQHDLHSHVMFSKEEVDLAEWARQNTDPNSRWLTGDQHNHWLFVLTGRQSLMTYRGWLWTHGYTYRPVESVVSRLFREPLQNSNLFTEYEVDYVVIGPNEKRVWRANEKAFSENFTLIKQTANYKIYQLAETS